MLREAGVGSAPGIDAKRRSATEAGVDTTLQVAPFMLDPSYGLIASRIERG